MGTAWSECFTTPYSAPKTHAATGTFSIIPITTDPLRKLISRINGLAAQGRCLKSSRITLSAPISRVPKAFTSTFMPRRNCHSKLAAKLPGLFRKRATRRRNRAPFTLSSPPGSSSLSFSGFPSGCARPPKSASTVSAPARKLAPGCLRESSGNGSRGTLLISCCHSHSVPNRLTHNIRRPWR